MATQLEDVPGYSSWPHPKGSDRLVVDGVAAAPTLSVGDLRTVLANLPADLPVYLEVLGDLIDVEGATVLGNGDATTAVHLVGAEQSGPA